jgi:uncharacterized repeat protein (TIGR01451 family)
VKFDISNLGTDFAFTTPNVGGNVAKDSNANPETGMSAPFTLPSGGSNLDVDAGIKLKSLTIEAHEVCLKDAPYVEYSVTANNFEAGANPVTIRWIDVKTNQVIATTPNLPLAGRVLWPQAAIDPVTGVGIAWPGWTQVGEEWVDNGSNLRPTVKVEFSVNPTAAVTINYPPAAPTCSAAPRAALGDRVWRDDNRNGLQDTGEAGVPGVKVTLFNGDHQQVGQPLVTDANGIYLFTNLVPGNYYVIFDNTTLPEGYTFTRRNVGAAVNAVSISADGQDDIDSDALVPWLDVSVKTDGSEPAFSKPLTFTISFTNTDSELDATNVVIAKTIPEGTTFVPGSSLLNWDCPSTTAGSVCTLTLPTLAAHTSASATFTVVLGDNAQNVPDQLVSITSLRNATLARTSEVTLADGQVNRSLDAGIVLVEVGVTLLGPTPPTGLPETEQPKQQFGLFLPSLSNNSAAAGSSTVVEPQGDAPQAEETQAVEPQNDEPAAEEGVDEEAQAPSLFLPTVENQE